MKLYLMCGLIGSGKSTMALKKRESDSNAVIVNRDALRQMFLGKYDYDRAYEDMVQRAADMLVRGVLMHRRDVIIDETNLTKDKRAYWIDIVKSYDPSVEIVCVYLTEKVNNVEYRMKDPRGKSREVWQEVYDRMLESFEPPTLNEFPVDSKLVEVGDPNV